MLNNCQSVYIKREKKNKHKINLLCSTFNRLFTHGTRSLRTLKPELFTNTHTMLLMEYSQITSKFRSEIT